MVALSPNQAGFQYLNDYDMYEWAVGDGDEYGENGCAVLFDCLPEEPGPYVMCYYSYKLDCIISVSETFEVRSLTVVRCSKCLTIKHIKHCALSSSTLKDRRGFTPFRAWS